MKLINSAPKVICSVAIQRVNMSLESTPSTLFTFDYIYIGINAIIKTWTISETSSKINVDVSLLQLFMLHSHAAERHLFSK